MRTQCNILNRRGLSIVELLISLSIVASLLIAVAVSINATLSAYKVNQQQATLQQRGRVALHRMVSMIREADAHMPFDDRTDDNDPNYAEDFAEGLTISDQSDAGIRLVRPEIVNGVEQDVEYRFVHSSTTHRLTVTRDIGTAVFTNVLLEGVENFVVSMEAYPIPKHRQWDPIRFGLKRATIRVTLRPTDRTNVASERSAVEDTLTLTAAVAPRQAVWQ